MNLYYRLEQPFVQKHILPKKYPERKILGVLIPAAEKAAEVGKLLADRAKSANINQVVFDRGGYQFTGRVKTLADSTRKAGLDF